MNAAQRTIVVSVMLAGAAAHLLTMLLTVRQIPGEIEARSALSRLYTALRDTAPAAGTPVTLRSLREAGTRPRNGNLDIYWMEASFLERLRPARAK